MRILYFHQYFSTPDGAAGVRSHAMARHLVARGHEVLVVCGSAARGDTGLSAPFVRGRRRGTIDGGIEVLEFELGYSNHQTLPRRTAAFLSFAWRSVIVALIEPCDLVFATSTPLTAGIPGIVARWLRRKPFVFEVRDLWPELPRAMGVIRNRLLLGMMSLLEWLTYRSAHRLVGLAPGIVDGIARRGVSRARITLVPNGCDVDIFAAPVQPRRPDGIDPDHLMAVYAGAHGVANGLDAVLAAAGELQRAGRDDVKIVLIGDGKTKPLLRERAIREGLRNVTFHPPVNKTALANLLGSADVGLQVLADVPAFYHGTSPNKFFDYLAAGLPVLINYPGWLANLVQEQQCGYAVAAADPRAFAAALAAAADDRAALRRMGQRSRALGQREFERGMLADRFCDWLERPLR